MHRLKKSIKIFIKILLGEDDIYGMEWGNPDGSLCLRYVRDHFLVPYITQDSVIVEIGPGGGRWTRYMLAAKEIYAIDYYQEMLREFNKNFHGHKNVKCVKNNGDDFPGISPNSIDFVFSYGTFVHLDIDIIDRYLGNMKPLLKTKANVVIQYSDKTKPLARMNEGFSDNDPDKMRSLILSHGYIVYEEDTKSISHSSIIRFGLGGDASPKLP